MRFESNYDNVVRYVILLFNVNTYFFSFSKSKNDSNDGGAFIFNVIIRKKYYAILDFVVVVSERTYFASISVSRRQCVRIIGGFESKRSHFFL